MIRTTCFLLLAITSSCVIAEGTYQQYDCPTERDANSCGTSCTKSSVSIEFKVNALNSTVLKNMYFNGKLKSVAFEHCKVVDADNWVCGSSEYFGLGLYVKSEQRLAGGIFVSGIDSNNAKGGKYSSYVCAKKKNLFGIFD